MNANLSPLPEAANDNRKNGRAGFHAPFGPAYTADQMREYAAAEAARSEAAERERIARWLEMQHGTRDQREHAEKLAGMLRRESRGA